MLVPPATTARAVTPGTPCTNGVARALWVGGLGTVTVQCSREDPSTVTFDVGNHTLLPVQCYSVTAATATLIVALY
jgi:hypothetical protein